MLTQENDVEIHALAARGWKQSAISRHTGRDRKTVRKYLAAGGPWFESRRRVVWSRCGTISPPGSSMTRTSGGEPARRAHRRRVRSVLSDIGPRATPHRAAAGVSGLQQRAVARRQPRSIIPRARRSSGTGSSCPTPRGRSRPMCSSVRCRTRGSSGRCSASR